MKVRELPGQTYITGYEVQSENLSDALASAALLVRDHENQDHMTRVNIEWDPEVDAHLVFLTVLSS